MVLSLQSLPEPLPLGVQDDHRGLQETVSVQREQLLSPCSGNGPGVSRGSQGQEELLEGILSPGNWFWSIPEGRRKAEQHCGHFLPGFLCGSDPKWG